MTFEHTRFTVSQGADSDTDNCLVVAKVREKLAVSKQKHRSFMWRDLISGS